VLAASGSRAGRGAVSQGWDGQRGGDAGSLLWALMERRAAGLGAHGWEHMAGSTWLGAVQGALPGSGPCEPGVIVSIKQ